MAEIGEPKRKIRIEPERREEPVAPNESPDPVPVPEHEPEQVRVSGEGSLSDSEFVV